MEADPLRAPEGSRFFHFDIQILRNVAVRLVPFYQHNARTRRLTLNTFCDNKKTDAFLLYLHELFYYYCSITHITQLF